MAGNPPIKLIIFFAALSAMTLTFVLNINHSNLEAEKSSNNNINIDHVNDQEDIMVMPLKRVGRFLAEDPKPRNPNAADHCNKDNQVCTLQGNNATCCNNKCQDLSNDKKNCGACKNKCKYTETCCRGECVDVTYDKRHCGKCNNPCNPGAYCTYSLCDYA